MNRARSVFLAIGLSGCMPALGAAALISVDLQSSYGTEGAPFHGVDPLASAASAAFASASVWNVLGSTGFNVQNPSFPNLVDSSGNPTGSAFSILGSISAYGTGNPAAALLTDYFYWNTPGATSTAIDWSITGLTPSRRYLLFVNGAQVGHAFSMVVDEDASGDLGNDTAQVVSSPAGSGVLFHVRSDATGKITGRGTAISGEASWAGFQVAEVLDPSYPVAAETKKCQDSIAKIGGKYFADRHKALTGCRGLLLKGQALFEDKAKTLPVTIGLDCATEYRAAGKIAKARQKVRDGLESKCTDAILGTLNACGSTVDELADATGATGCLIESVDQKVDSLILDEYGY
jgi:hypothetical protein